jgi:hypothetical protein
MPTTYVCLDSNILFRIVTQGKPGCEESLWLELTKLVEGGRVTFLLPKIVLMEFGKLVRNVDDEIAYQIGKLDSRLPAFVGKSGKQNDKEADQQSEKPKLWNELTKSFEAFVREQLTAWRNKTSAEFNQRAEALLQWLNSATPMLLPFDADILLKARERIFEGRFPWREDSKERPEGDCCIVESLLKFFTDENATDPQFLLCTENLRDFATTVEGGAGAGSQQKMSVVSPRFADDGLPAKNRVFTELKSLLQFVKDAKPAEPPAKEAIKEAEAREIENEAGREESAIQTEAVRLADYLALARAIPPQVQERVAEYSTFARAVAPLLQARSTQFSELARALQPMVQPMLMAAQAARVVEPYLRVAMANYNALHPSEPDGELSDPPPDDPSPPSSDDIDLA